MPGGRAGPAAADRGARPGERRTVVSVDMRRMERVLDIDETARLARVQATVDRDGGADVTMRTHLASHALVAADVEAAREWIQVERSRVALPR